MPAGAGRENGMEVYMPCACLFCFYGYAAVNIIAFFVALEGDKMRPLYLDK